MTLVERLSIFLSHVHADGPEDAFYEHAVRARSQYDEQYRRMATEILAARHLVKEAARALEDFNYALQEAHYDPSHYPHSPGDWVRRLVQERNRATQKALEARNQRVVAEVKRLLDYEPE